MDLNPKDLSCIYSTLVFVEWQAEQLLWLKVVNILLSRVNVVCHLGGFHVLMSYLGTLGTLMAGSGLTDVLQTCYGSASVSQMMSGKAYARTVRGHWHIQPCNCMDYSCMPLSTPTRLCQQKCLMN